MTTHKDRIWSAVRGEMPDVLPYVPRIDLGIDVPVDTFVAQVNAQRPSVLGLSALLTTTMPEMKRVLDAMEEAGIRSEVKVIIGGAPVNDRYAKNIGADGYASDAGEAVALTKDLLGL
jgi:5-methyltetrahydrofolate--homocysteine methyltransferase